MKTQSLVRYTAREWMRALGLSALCGAGAIATWFLVMLATRGMSQAVSDVAKQSLWVLPAVIGILSPVMLFAFRHDAGSANRGS